MCVIERRRRDVLLRLVDAERALRERELTVRRERGAGQHDALRALEERRAQIVGDVERRRVDFVAALAFEALDPGDRFVGRQLRAFDRVSRGRRSPRSALSRRRSASATLSGGRLSAACQCA